ncbi:MAG: alpha/beta fold hydrolase [Candidatus Nanohalobium sp.]
MKAGTYSNGYEYIKIREHKDKQILYIPGLNDEMIRMTDYPVILNYYMRGLKDYQVTVVSRKRGLEDEVSTEDMAKAYKQVLREEGDSHVIGVSMGGMIAQHLAEKSPHVQKMVLGFSGPKLGKGGRKKIEKWINLLEKKEISRFYREMIKDTFSGISRPLAQVALPILHPIISRPSTEDLIKCSEACLEHDTSAEISGISNDVLLVGSRRDDFFPEEMVRKTAERVGGETKFVEGRHGAFFQKHSQFHQNAVKFLNRNL